MSTDDENIDDEVRAWDAVAKAVSKRQNDRQHRDSPSLVPPGVAVFVKHANGHTGKATVTVDDVTPLHTTVITEDGARRQRRHLDRITQVPGMADTHFGIRPSC